MVFKMLLQSPIFCLSSDRLKLNSSDSDPEFFLLKYKLNICTFFLRKYHLIEEILFDSGVVSLYLAI